MSRRGAGGAGALALLGFVVAAAAGLLLQVLVARGLGAAGAGAFATVVALTTLLSTVLVLGADTGLLRALAAARAAGRPELLRATTRAGVLPVALACLVSAAALAAAAGPLSGTLLQGPGTGPASAALLALAVPGTALALLLLSGAARGLGTIVPYVALQQVGLPVGRLVVVGAVLAAGGGLAAVLAAWTLPLLPVVVVAALVVRARLRALVGRGATGRAAAPGTMTPDTVRRDFWRFAAPRGLDALFAAGLTWLDVVLVAVLRSPAEAGVYAAASRFVTSGALALQASRMAVAPVLARELTTGATAAAERVYAGATVAVVLLSWPVFLVLAVFPEPLLSVFGPEFPAAATALTVLALAMLYVTAAGNVSTVLLMAGRSRSTARNSGTALGVLLALDLVLVPRYGITGAALGWAAGLLTETTLATLAVRRRVGLRGAGAATVLAGGLAVAVYGAGGLLLRAVGPNVPELVAGLAVLTGTYALLVNGLRERLRRPPGGLRKGAGHRDGRD